MLLERNILATTFEYSSSKCRTYFYGNFTNELSAGFNRSEFQ